MNVSLRGVRNPLNVRGKLATLGIAGATSLGLCAIGCGIEPTVRSADTTPSVPEVSDNGAAAQVSGNASNSDLPAQSAPSSPAAVVPSAPTVLPFERPDAAADVVNLVGDLSSAGGVTSTLALMDVQRVLTFVGLDADSSTSVVPGVRAPFPMCVDKTEVNGVKTLEFADCQFMQSRIDGQIVVSQSAIDARLTVVLGDRTANLVACLSFAPSTQPPMTVDGGIHVDFVSPRHQINADVVLDNVQIDAQKCPVAGTLNAGASITSNMKQKDKSVAVTFGQACGDVNVAQASAPSMACAEP